MTGLPLTFPAIGFSPDAEGPHRSPAEQVHGFRDEAELQTCRRSDLKEDAHKGMEIVDSAGRTWAVRAVMNPRIEGSFWRRIYLLWADARRIDLELEEQAPTSLAEVKNRVCKSIDEDPDQWRDDEAIAGEDGPPMEEAEFYIQLKAKVRAAESIADIAKRLDLGGGL